MRSLIALCLFVAISCEVNCQVLQVHEKTSTISFAIRNFGLTVEGSLARPEGTIVYNPGDPASSTFTLKVQSNTIDTGIGLRDQHLKSNEYLDVQRYPYLKFISTEVTATDDNNIFVVSGYLTVKGTTKRIQIPVTVKMSAAGFTFSGNFSVNRRDFGVGRNSVSLADELTVDFVIQAVVPS